jgi:hypothetical protein
MARRAKSLGAVLGAACAITLGVTSTASANSWVWQSYTRDSTWNCGQAGSTKQVGNLYILPCVKVVYGDWQAILIVTALSSGGYIGDQQIGLTDVNGTEAQANSWACGDGTGNTYVWIAPHTTLACFSPTVYTPNTLVDGEFQVMVNDRKYPTYYSPWVMTTS